MWGLWCRVMDRGMYRSETDAVLAAAMEPPPEWQKDGDRCATFTTCSTAIVNGCSIFLANAHHTSNAPRAPSSYSVHQGGHHHLDGAQVCPALPRVGPVEIPVVGD